jgi:hypothetical protein
MKKTLLFLNVFTVLFLFGQTKSQAKNTTTKTPASNSTSATHVVSNLTAEEAGKIFLKGTPLAKLTDVKALLHAQWKYNYSELLKKDGSIVQKIYTNEPFFFEPPIVDPSKAIDGVNPTNTTTPQSAEVKPKSVAKIGNSPDSREQTKERLPQLEETVNLFNVLNEFVYFNNTDSTGGLIIYRNENNVMRTLTNYDIRYVLKLQAGNTYISYSTNAFSEPPISFLVGKCTAHEVTLIDLKKKQAHYFSR